MFAGSVLHYFLYLELLSKFILKVVILINITDYSFSVNEFEEPKKYEGAKGIMMLLTRLLLLEPGTFESHPSMGVGLVSKYRYSMAGEEYKLRSDFKHQIEKYLPDLQGVDVQVEFKNYTFYISVEVNRYVYNFQYDIEGQNLQSQILNLDDLK